MTTSKRLGLTDSISLPTHVFLDKNLGSDCKVLFSILSSFPYEEFPVSDETITPTNEELSDLMSFSVRKIQYLLSDLVKFKYIRIKIYDHKRTIALYGTKSGRD